MSSSVAAQVDLSRILANLHVVSIPLRTRFRGVDVREIALIEGPAGWGEFSPFLEYGPAEAARWLAAAVEASYLGWPQPVREAVGVNATVPAVPARDVPALLARYDGCRTVKVKVAERGQRLPDDVDRVAAVREVLGAQGRVRVDANGGWGVQQAVDALGALARYDLEYAEQPVESVEGLRSVRMALARNGVEIPVAADESIRKAADPLRVARLEAADLVVVKVAPLGGVRSALQIVADCGLPAVVSSALDSSVGIRAGLALAAALPELPHDCGLGTLALFAGDVLEDPLVPRAGRITLRPAVPEQPLLHRWAASPQRHDWWAERVRAAYAQL